MKRRRPPWSRYALPSLVTLGVLLSASCAEETRLVGGTGTVEAREVTVSAETSGTLVEMPVEEGTRVKKGETIARLDDERATQKRRKARAAVEAAEAQLTLLLEGAAPEDVRQAEQAVEQAREELELARKEAQRVAGLYESGSISQSELDKARARLNQARAVFNSREAALEKARGPARPAELRSARAKLEQARAELALADRSLEDTHIVAPSSGTVVTTAREAGEFVTAGSPIVEIADLSEVYVDVYVSEPTLSRFTLGAAARIKPDGTAETLRGHVAFVSPRAEFTPTNVQTDEQRAKLVYRVKVRAENPAGTLKIGMPVEVEILPKGDADRGSSDG